MENEKAIWRVAAWVAALILVLWAASGLLLFSVKERGSFGDMFGAINALFSGLAFGGVVIAILLQRQEMRDSRRDFTASAKAQQQFYQAERSANNEDHRRRRLEATMSYISGMSTYRRLDHALSSRITELTAHEDKSAEAAELLAQIENFAAGIKLDVFDIRVVNSAKGGYLLDFYTRWFPYMQSRIDQSSYGETLYNQFEWLVCEIAHLRGKDLPQPLRRPKGAVHKVAQPRRAPEPRSGPGGSDASFGAPR